ncbi:MAG: diguanylate cyclase [Ruminococcus sp.]|nr:diguanylate cyclase [Ruminococcus sp.]
MNTFENSFTIFITALEYIENNLYDEFSQEDIAANCYCSLSSLQKTWKFCTYLTLKEYIAKRRITLAGRDILKSDMNVLDIAMKYGYNSHEVFTRAFTKVWGVPPSRFKKEWKGSCDLYPRLNTDYIEKEEVINMRNVKKFDVSEFYDYLKSQAGTYILCFDIRNLMPINDNIGRDAGDKVILEAFRRINEAADENMLCLRMGGDEFVMITESRDEKQVAEIAQSVLSQNDTPIIHNGAEIGVSMWCGAIMIDKKLRYSVLCSDFETVIGKARESGKFEFMQ